MGWSNTLLYLVVNAFHIHLFLLACRIFFGPSKVKAPIELLCFLGFYLVNSIAFLALQNPFLNLATSIFPLLAITFLYHGKPRWKLLAGIFICLASMLFESISLSILQLLGLRLAAREPIVVNVMANMLYFSAELVLRKIWRGEERGVLRVEYWLAILTLPIGSIVITALVYGSGGYRAGSNLVIVSILIAMNVLAFHLYELLGRYYLSHYEHDLLKQQNAAYAHEFELIRQADLSNKQLRHDMKNHIAAMRQLLERQDFSGLWGYLEHFKEYTVFGKYASSGNPDFDSILNYKLSAASAIGAKIELDTAIPTHLPIEAFDISVILGNLLDNANEALAQSEVKELNVGIRYDRGMIFIHVSNTYCGEVKKEVRDGAAIYISTKGQPECHGLGLSGVAAVVEKYGGFVHIDDAKGKFAVDIVLYLS